MLLIAAFFCAVCAVCLVFKRRFEQALPITLLAAMPALTALAMLGRLSLCEPLAIAVLAAAALLLVYALLAKRITPLGLGRSLLESILTPGFVCFVLITVFFLYATEPMVVWWRDDSSHWGLTVKSLWAFDGLVDHARDLEPAFSTYTPGLQVLQWWMMRAVGEFQEPMLYFVLFMSYAAFLLPFTSRIRWKQAYLIPVFTAAIVAFPVWGNMVSYIFLGVDTSLGLCFGYTLVQLWLSRDGDRTALLSAALGLCGLVLIKQIGILFAVMALMMLPLTRRCGKKELLVALAPLAVWGCWLVFCQLMGLNGFHNSGMSERISELLSGTYVLPDGADGVAESLVNALTAPYTDSLIFHQSPLVFIPKILWLAVTAAGPWLLSRISGSKALKKVALLFAGITAVYLLIQYVSFFTVFYHETSVYVHDKKQNMILLIERYMAPILLGTGVFSLQLLLDAFPRGLAKAWKGLPAAVAAGLALCLALTVNWGVLYENLLPSRYFQHARALGLEGELLMDHSWAEDLADYENAHVLVGLEENAEHIRSFRYVFAPIRFELPERSFTENAETLAEYLAANRITHVICFDDANLLYGPAAELTEYGELYPWTLYEVESSEDGIVLWEY